jgi:hypothetical protein
VTFNVLILQGLSHCYVIPFPCYIIRTQSCLFLFWFSSLLHYSPLWCSDPPRVKEHHLDLGVCIFYSIITRVAVLFSIVASVMVLMNHNTKGTRQGNIKYALKTKHTALLFMINVACIFFLYSGTFSIAYWQPRKPREYMSRCNTWPVGGCMI